MGIKFFDEFEVGEPNILEKRKNDGRRRSQMELYYDDDVLQRLFEGTDKEINRRKEVLWSIICAEEFESREAMALEFGNRVGKASCQYIAEYLTETVRRDKYFDPVNKIFKIFPDEGEDPNFKDAYFEYTDGPMGLRLVLERMDGCRIYLSTAGIEQLTDIVCKRTMEAGSNDGKTDSH